MKFRQQRTYCAWLSALTFEYYHPQSPHYWSLPTYRDILDALPLPFLPVAYLDSNVFPLPLGQQILSIHTWNFLSSPYLLFLPSQVWLQVPASPPSLSKWKLWTVSTQVLSNLSSWSHFLCLKSHTTNCLHYSLTLAMLSPVTNILSPQQDGKLILLSISGLIIIWAPALNDIKQEIYNKGPEELVMQKIQA